MVAPEPGAKSKDELLTKLSFAYVKSAENVAECNIRRTTGLALQRKIAARISLETDDGNTADTGVISSWWSKPQIIP